MFKRGLLVLSWFVLAFAKDYYARNYKVHLDNFNFVNDKKFKIRYLVNYDYWEDGPILFYTGNEGDIELFAQNTGFMYELGKELRALIIFAEHRYYGMSQPFSQNSQNNMQYLTSENALVDFIYLIDHLKKKHSIKKVIAIGGSYGGMLSAWIRMKYPHMVDGAISASAPLLYFYGLIPCNKFLNIVSETFKNASEDCFMNIKDSWSTINNMFDIKNSNLLLLSKLFKLCPDQNLSSEDKETFKSWIGDIFVTMAMANYPYATDFLGPMPAWPIQYACNHINKSETEILINLYNIMQVNLNYTGNVICNKFKDDSIIHFNKPSMKLNYLHQVAKPSLGYNNWIYQSCEEMVMPQCSNNNKESMFEPMEWNITDYVLSCKKIFNVTTRRNWLAQYYGSKKIIEKSATRIIFTNGFLDPWSGGGIYYNDTNRDIISLVIPEGAHHLDLRASNPADPESVKRVRKMIIEYALKWVNTEISNSLDEL